MTNEQINIAIAEACGWTDCSIIDGILCGLPIGVTSLNGRYDIIPNYCNDLNAMHEAENVLPRQLYHVDYWQKGYGRFQTIVSEMTVTPFSATASQRAEAFLRTLGRWEGEK
jgi:hypothetical protein